MKIRYLYILSFSIFVASCARPTAKFSVKENTPNIAPSKIIFENKSKKADRYVWEFGDGTTATDSNATHRYVHSGNYTVILKAYKGKKMSQTKEQVYVKPPETCLVEIQTEFGAMLFSLSSATPQHRDNFIKLAEEGFFNDLLFHRIIEGFMIQGGDPNSRNASPEAMLGTGGPGYTIPAEFSDTLVHKKGALAAARMGDNVNPTKASSGSQFYIVQGKPVVKTQLDVLEARRGVRYTPEQREFYTKIGGTPMLDNQYTVFGEMVSGQDVLDKIAASPKNQYDRPLKDVKMKVIVIK